MRTEQADGVTVVSWRPPAFCRTQVLCESTQASMAVTNVYLMPRSQMRSRRRSSLASAS
jgi:hypothetical protein